MFVISEERIPENQEDDIKKNHEASLLVEQSAAAAAAVTSAPAPAPTAVIPLTPEERIRMLCFKIGDSKDQNHDHYRLAELEVITSQVRGLSAALLKDAENGHEEAICHILVEAISLFPNKTETYATLVSYIHFKSIDNHQLGMKIISSATNAFHKWYMLYSGFLRSRLLFRFLCICTKLRAVSQESLIEAIQSMIEQKQSLRSDLLYLVISSLPWIHEALSENHLPLLTSMLQSCQMLTSEWSRLSLGCLYGLKLCGDIPLQELPEFFQRVSPYRIMSPDEFHHENATAVNISSMKSIHALRIVDTALPLQLPFVLNLTSGEFPTPLEHEFFIRESLLEIIQCYGPNIHDVSTILKQSCRTDRSVERVIVDELFGSLLSLPCSLHGNIYYERIISKLCFTLPGTFSRLVDETFTPLIVHSSFYSDPELLNRVAYFISYHIHSFGPESWPWLDWANEQPSTDKSLLIKRTIELLDLLCYPGYMASILPGGLTPPCQPMIASQFISAEGIPNEISENLIKLLRVKPSAEELVQQFSSNILPSGYNEGRRQFQLDLIMHTILHLGNPSLSHLSAAIERSLPLLTSFTIEECLNSTILYWNPIQTQEINPKEEDDEEMNKTRIIYPVSITEFSILCQKLCDFHLGNERDIIRWLLAKDRITSKFWAGQDWFWRLIMEDILGRVFSNYRNFVWKMKKAIHNKLPSSELKLKVNESKEFARLVLQDFNNLLQENESLLFEGSLWKNIILRKYNYINS